MDAGNLKEKLVQNYYDGLRGLVAGEYRKNVSNSVLTGLDDAVAVLAEESQFAMIIQNLDMQTGWLKSTESLIYDVCDLGLVPGTSKIIKERLNEADKDFHELFCSLTKIARRRHEAKSLLRQLQKRKRHYVDIAYWAIFKDEDHHSPVVLGEILRQLEAETAMIPGTLAHRLIDERKLLCELFPDFMNTALDAWLAELRFKFLVDKNPSQMDDFKDKIIQIVQEAVAAGGDSFVLAETKEKLLATTERAKAETFSSTI